MVLKFGMVGGGIGSYIGDLHYRGATMDDLAELVCGAFSRNPETNAATAKKRHITDPGRIYADYREMAEREASRPDKIDFVAIMTPNNTHYEIAKCFMENGFHIVCDKPLAIGIQEAEELAAIAHEKDLLFGMTYTYTGYAAVRQGREMIKKGMIGDILHVRAAYPEDWIISMADDKGNIDESAWRFHPEIIGPSLCTNDIGTHAEQLIVQFTGLNIQRVLAKFDTYPRSLKLETNTTILLDFGNDISGEIWASNIAIGHECGCSVYVIGTKGALEWSNDNPDLLLYTPRSMPTQIYSAGRDYFEIESRRLSRVAQGHHEGYFEAFGNIYHSYLKVLEAKLKGIEPDNYTFPTVDDGLHGIRFVEACVKSNREGNVWEEI